MSECNGSTEPPTQAGWYWFEGHQQLHDGRAIDLGRMMCYIPPQRNSGLGPYVYAFGVDALPGERPQELPLSAMRGTWYGPLQPPWEPQQ